jgi:anti-anti-sigma factor
MSGAEFEVVRNSRDAGGSKVSVLKLQGQLDAETFPRLQGELEQVVDSAAQPKVVLDCTDLEYISSAGLGVLSKMTKEFRDKEGDLRLAALPEKINSVVSLLGFDQVIKVFPQADDAVQSFGE